jgi:MSHA pilin protein MshC
MMRTKLSGFTLVELVGVLVIVAVLAMVAVPRFFSKSSFDARAFSDQTQSMLRYAQKLAIAQNRPVFVLLTTGANPRIALCFVDTTCASRVAPPSGQNSGSAVTLAACGSAPADRAWFCEAPPSGIAFATTPATAAFYFSALGKPHTIANADLPQLQISVTGDGGTRNIIVETETGYVHP